jgi:glucan phosphoethanolaminetransferase (alkaline phosphatase superfamily)
MKHLKPILFAGFLVGLVDITAASITVRLMSGMTPFHLLQGVAGGLLGRGTYQGGFATAALGLVLQFTMAFIVVTVFYALTRYWPLPRKLSGAVVVGLLYGAAVFVINNFLTAPFVSWIRSLYLHTPVSFKAPMGWPQFIIHLFCVGLPAALVIWGFSRKSSG